jgi:restriction endonuclease Mrr
VRQVSHARDVQLPLFAPLRVQLVGIGQILSEQLTENPSLIYQISPEDFEEFICERLFAMGLEPKRIGEINRKDGGVDIIFYPRLTCAFPFLGAAQVKHHRNPNTKEGPATVREFAGTIAGRSFNAGLLVTNTSFSPDAMWFAREHAKLLRLRDLVDIQRWLLNNFSDEEEWREIPTSIELCPGVIIKIR